MGRRGGENVRRGVSLDLGTSTVVHRVKYAPRRGFGGRMVGGTLQGSNTEDFSSGVVTLFTITSAPPDNVLTTQRVTERTAFRYVRYLGPPNGFDNVAEVDVYGTSLLPSPRP